MARTVSSSAFFWERVRLNLRSWLLVLFVGVLVLSATLYGMFIKPQHELRDTANAPLQQSTGVVSFVNPGFVGSGGTMSPDQVFITLNDTPKTRCIYEIYTPHTPMLRGQNMQVAYRVGKSGQIYIFNAEPIREAKP